MPRLLFMVSGRARVFLPLYGGRTVLIETYRPGDIVGDLEFFLDTSATCSVQCTTEVESVSVRMDAVRRGGDRMSPVILALGRSVAGKLRQSSVSGAVHSGYSVAARLAAYFLTHRDPEFQARNLTELSEWLGTSYRHLTRTLSELTSAGALAKKGGRYVIHDQKKLTELAEEVLSEEPESR